MKKNPVEEKPLTPINPSLMNKGMRRKNPDKYDPPSEDFFRSPGDPDRLEEEYEEGEEDYEEEEEDKEDLIQNVPDEETAELDSEAEHIHTLEPEDLQEEIAREVEGLEPTMGHEDDPEKRLDIEEE